LRFCFKGAESLNILCRARVSIGIVLVMSSSLDVTKPKARGPLFPDAFRVRDHHGCLAVVLYCKPDETDGVLSSSPINPHEGALHNEEGINDDMSRQGVL
jgi:hypothetical protein